MINNLFLQTFDHWAFFGIGMGNDASYLYMTEGDYLNAHSLFWKTWIETGLVGLTLFAAFLTVVLKRGLRSVASQALLPMAVALVIFAVTLGGANTSAFWFVIALALTQRPSAQAPAEIAQPQTRVGFLPQSSATGESVTT